MELHPVNVWFCLVWKCCIRLARPIIDVYDSMTLGGGYLADSAGDYRFTFVVGSLRDIFMWTFLHRISATV